MNSYTITVERNKLIGFLEKQYANGFLNNFIALINYAFRKCDRPDVPYRCEKEDDLKNYLMDLFNDIKDNGINEPLDIYIGIGNYHYKQEHTTFCNGFYFHGHRRLAIAELLDIPILPVKIITDDENLQKLADMFFNIYDGKLKCSLYQPIEHPFFELCTIQNKDIDKKIETIKNNLQNKLPVMDFGCNNGYVSRQLTRDGYKITGIDCDKEMFEAQDLFKKIGLQPIDFRYATIEKFMQDNLNFKCNVIALSLFHHYFETKELFYLLDNIITKWIKYNVNTLVIEHRFKQKYYKNFTDENNYDDYWMIKCGFIHNKIIYNVEGKMIFVYRKSLYC